MGLIAQRIADQYLTGAVNVGAVKANPLPPGRYWIDIFPDGVAAWVGWSGGNLATVQVEKTELYSGKNKLFEVLGWVYPWVPTPQVVEQPDRAWVIFNVSAPTPWTIAESVGYPNNAPKGVVNTSDDTVTKPDPFQERDDWLEVIKWTGIGLVGVGALWGVAKLIRG